MGELDRLQIMTRLAERRLTRRRAAALLGLSERQVRRLYRAFRREGAAALGSRRRGRPRAIAGWPRPSVATTRIRPPQRAPEQRHQRGDQPRLGRRERRVSASALSAASRRARRSSRSAATSLAGWSRVTSSRFPWSTCHGSPCSAPRSRSACCTIASSPRRSPGSPTGRRAPSWLPRGCRRRTCDDQCGSGRVGALHPATGRSGRSPAAFAVHRSALEPSVLLLRNVPGA